MNDFFDKENVFLTIEEYLCKWEDCYNMTEKMLRFESYHGKLDYIRDYYINNEKLILDTFKKSKHLFFNPYPLDWQMILTPIEMNAWLTIRMKGDIVLYPQYPVLNYHLDFANPGLKIGLELDGAEFHNKERDLKRDRKLRELGWKIYRISGKEMNRDNYKILQEINELDDEDEQYRELEYWLTKTGNGIIEAIKESYFSQKNDKFYNSTIGHFYSSLCGNTLIGHQLLY